MFKGVLKKLLKTKELKRFFDSLDGILVSSIFITDCNNNVLYGEKGSYSHEYILKYKDEKEGCLYGDENSAVISDLLMLWLKTEHEKKSLSCELLDRYREVNFYFDITEQLASNPDPEDVARFLINEAQRMIKTGDISIFLKEDGDLKVSASTQSEENSLNVLNACKHIMESVMAARKGEIINDFSNDTRHPGEICVGSVICVPLVVKEKALGVIIVSSKNCTDYTAGDLKLLSTLAYQTASSIENARLFARLKETIEELKDKQKQLIQSIKTRTEFSHIFISVVMMVSLYTFLIVLLDKFDIKDAHIFVISRAIEIAFISANVWLVFKSRLPIRDFGVTLENSKKSISESLVVTAVLMILLAGIKIYLINTVPIFHGQSLISWKYVGWDYLTYIFVAPFQEFLCRGIVQNSIQRFMIGRLNWLWAIVLTSLLFGVFHIHESIELAITAILGGLIWGALFARHRTLTGVSICHFVLGNWLGILGLWDVIAHS